MHEHNLRIHQPPVWASPSALGTFEGGQTISLALRAFAGTGSVSYELFRGDGVVVSSSGEATCTLPNVDSPQGFVFGVKATADEGGMQSVRMFRIDVIPSVSVAVAPWEPVPPPPPPAPEPSPAPVAEPPPPAPEPVVEPVPAPIKEPEPAPVVAPAPSAPVMEPEVVAPQPAPVAPVAPEPVPAAPVVAAVEVSVPPPPAPEPAPVAKDEIWTTAAGSVGIYASGERISLTFEAKGARMFHLIRGRLPQGTMLTKSTGRLSGTLRAQSTTTTFQFTLRADTGQGFSDRTFKLTVKGAW